MPMLRSILQRFHYKPALVAAAAVVFAAASACSRDTGPTIPTVDGPPPVPVLLKDITIPNLPSPYYHFEYDAAGKMKLASFASGLTLYDLTYAGDRLSEMRNNIIVNHDRLVYSYDNAGRVAKVTYVDGAGVEFTRVHLAYSGQRLTALERERKTQSGAFVIDKTMSFSYDDAGNLFELTEHHTAIAGVQDEATSVDRFENYDTGINVDGFSLIHDEFFDHLVLLPAVVLQKGNPRRETLTGDGINYRVDYTYDYDDKNRPLAKHGALIITNGADAGQTFQTTSVFTYY